MEGMTGQSFDDRESMSQRSHYFVNEIKRPHAGPAMLQNNLKTVFAKDSHLSYKPVMPLALQGPFHLANKYTR